MDNLKRIDQQGIKSLLRDRLENSTKYLDTPLIIWRSNFDDGLQEEILEEVLDDYNLDRSGDERKWFRRTLLAGAYQTEYDLSDPQEIRTVFDDLKSGVYQVGILAVDPKNMMRDYKMDASSLSDYQSLLNDRRWKDITMKFDAPIVAYMLFSEKEFETPEKYPNAEQYVFEPDFDQWADWALSKRRVRPFLIDFIRGDGNHDGIMYRWYNLFNTQNEETAINLRGVIYPKKWYKVLFGSSSIDDVTDAVIKEVSTVSGISTDIKDQLKKYIDNHNGGSSS